MFKTGGNGGNGKVARLISAASAKGNPATRPVGDLYAPLPLSSGTSCLPGAPRGLNVTAVSRSTDPIWTAPSSGGSLDITGYDVRLTTSTTVDDDFGIDRRGHIAATLSVRKRQ